MIKMIENFLTFCCNQHISQARKLILINTTLMALPIYYINVYPIPGSILDHASKAARKLLWSKSDNCSGIRLSIGILSL